MRWASGSWARKMVDHLLIGLLADGHVLLEGVRLAKTLAIQTLSQAVDVEFSRFNSPPTCSWPT